jgi:hypothetical protein
MIQRSTRNPLVRVTRRIGRSISERGWALGPDHDPVAGQSEPLGGVKIVEAERKIVGGDDDGPAGGLQDAQDAARCPVPWPSR